MSIPNLDNAKRLREQGKRLGRDGLSQRINQLVLEFVGKYPEGHYREGMMLAGKLHAIFLATLPGDYWREVGYRGFYSEIESLQNFKPHDTGLP